MNTRTDQLRVRLRREERQQLELYIQKRGKKETISDVIRASLAWCISPDKNMEVVHVSTNTFITVSKLAVELKREPQQVIKDCVEGTLAMVERKTPLIVQEIRLRRRYQSGQ